MSERKKRAKLQSDAAPPSVAPPLAELPAAVPFASPQALSVSGALPEPDVTLTQDSLSPQHSLVTMHDIAARAGVSQATVSYVFNNKLNGRRVGAATTQRVLQAAAELGYRRNQIARSMVTGKSHVLGFVVHSPELQSAARLLGGVLDEADERNYFIKVLRWRRGEIRPIVERCLELRLDGVITLFVDPESLETLRQELGAYGIPVAVLYSSLPLNWGIRVVPDDRQAMQLAIEHLVQSGHRAIALVSSRTGDGVGAALEAAYQSVMQEHGLPVPPGYIVHDYYNTELTARVTDELLQHPTRPTAILTYRDMAAMVVLRTVKRAGLQVPQDMAIIGNGDLSMTRVSDPPLTTLAIPYYEMGRAIVRHLIQAVETMPTDDNTSANEAVEEYLPQRLIIRESTMPAPDAAASDATGNR